MNGFLHDIAPSVEELPLEPGSFVELHSLQNQAMNGRTGEIQGWEIAPPPPPPSSSSGVGRFVVALDDDHENNTPHPQPQQGGHGRLVRIKPHNLRRMQLPPASIRRQAQAIVRSNQGDRNVALNVQAIQMDRCCVLAHFLLGQRAQQQRGDWEEALCHYQRAAAQSYAVSIEDDDKNHLQVLTRIELANVHGELGNTAQEERHIRQALEMEPWCNMAKLTLFLSLTNRSNNNNNNNNQEQERFDEALQVMDEILDPQNIARDTVSQSQDQVQAAARVNLYQALLHYCSTTVDGMGRNGENFRPDLDVALERLDRLLAVAEELPDERKPEPRDWVFIYLHKSKILAYKAFVFHEQDCIDPCQENLELALEKLETFGNQIPALNRSYAINKHANILEIRAAGQPQQQQQQQQQQRTLLLQQALEKIMESERIYSDPSNEQAKLRLQHKLDPNLTCQLVGYNPLGPLMFVPRG